MTRKELDTLWFQAMRQSIAEGEDFIRYHFANLVAAEKNEEIAALQAENERLRAALLRIKETKVFLGAIAQEMMDAALRREEDKT